MSEIGLFPLGLVLLPTEQVPLHIFEPRYRELIGESLEHGRPFGIVYADDDGLRQIGTLATVTEVVERFEDGRLNILVEGGARFRLLELTEGRAFVTGRVEPVDDQHDPAEPADVERALALFDRLAELTSSDVEAPDADAARAVVRDRGSLRLRCRDQAGAPRRELGADPAGAPLRAARDRSRDGRAPEGDRRAGAVERQGAPSRMTSRAPERC